MKNEKTNAIALIRVLMKPQTQFIFFVLWFIVIVVLSVIPDNSPDTLKINRYELRLDYLKHFLVYLPLGFTLRAMRQWGWLLVLLTGLVVAVLPEGLQYFLPYRTYNPFDLVSNLTGLVTGAAAAWFMKRIIKQPE